MKPGWYVRREMVNTLEFWDGKGWSGQTAPAYRGIRTTVATVAGGVFFGMLLVLLVAALMGATVDW